MSLDGLVVKRKTQIIYLEWTTRQNEQPPCFLDLNTKRYLDKLRAKIVV